MIQTQLKLLIIEITIIHVVSFKIKDLSQSSERCTLI